MCVYTTQIYLTKKITYLNHLFPMISWKCWLAPHQLNENDTLATPERYKQQQQQKNLAFQRAIKKKKTVTPTLPKRISNQNIYRQ